MCPPLRPREQSSVNGVSAQNISQSKEVQSYRISRKGPLKHLWDMKGVVHVVFRKQGHTVNSEQYISTLEPSKWVHSGRDSILQHDKARPHTRRQNQDALGQLKLPALPHPAYNPDLAPSDYFLFLQLKKHLKGNHYDSDER